MKAIVLSNESTMIILRPVDDCCKLRINELIKLHSVETDYLQKIRGLFFRLLEYSCLEEHSSGLQEAGMTYFKLSDSNEVRKNKLYCFIAFQIGWTEQEVFYDRFGNEIETREERISMQGASQDKWSELYEITKEYLAKWIDLTDFEKYHKEKNNDWTKHIGAYPQGL